MNILIVGSGGREHALLWALHREAPTSQFFLTPGNPGTAALATNLPISATDLDGIVTAVDQHRIHLTVVGPEVPLALGLADRLRDRRKAVFGPAAGAARIESSKAYAKALMNRAGVPTAASRTFTDQEKALAWVGSHREPLVVKASGLAAGKGAVVCATRAEAADAVRAMMDGHTLGEAGDEVVIEDFMAGEELSIFAITNGSGIVILPAAQDHKRLLEGDRGPNTGGMGAYSPVSIATPQLLERIEKTVLRPTLDQMAREGDAFSGLLYAGLMIDTTGNPRVVEFNCRFGDPETEAVLPLIDAGLLDAINRVATGEEPSAVTVNNAASAVTTVLAARGYPDKPVKGASITVPAALGEGIHVFHAGTALSADGALRTAGGRVVAVTGVGSTFEEAQRRSRAGAEAIEFEGKVFRRDIGWREAGRRPISSAIIA